MSLHCPTCGAADDGTRNGWVYRAYRSEHIVDAVKDLAQEWYTQAKTEDTEGECFLTFCADNLLAKIKEATWTDVPEPPKPY